MYACTATCALSLLFASCTRRLNKRLHNGLHYGVWLDVCTFWRWLAIILSKNDWMHAFCSRNTGTCLNSMLQFELRLTQFMSYFGTKLEVDSKLWATLIMITFNKLLWLKNEKIVKRVWKHSDLELNLCSTH